VYNISQDDVQSIFKTYPAVKLKFIQNVPQKMSEKDFWTKFFQSYYFRKDQINSISNDLFVDCALKDDEELRTKMKRALIDPIDIIDSQKNFANEDVRILILISLKKDCLV
jgi:transcription initiation factor TFIIH subunit 1